MKKKTIILVLGLIITLAFVTVALGTNIIVKTDNNNFQKDPQFYKALGHYLAEQGDYSKAISAYEYCLLLGEDAEVRNNLAVLYYQAGKYSEAINHLRAIIVVEPNNPSYHYDLAINLVDRFRNTDDKKITDLEEALAEFEKANAIEQGYAHSLENIGVLKTILKN
ncbi:tetratricopeptide repeat protein [Candidatus Woesearchaeota archaeon]|nr:tetratricopeptide repeat protein [Candidatus Woesearchaeota archaeon]